ncbi:MAG: VCBS repeat-containing protein [Candidatus Lambdaproteobacteria bacterium]|nr:VCBS repeat-containing protein [Candidatus Lambdaproteobacteria bacterium]
MRRGPWAAAAPRGWALSLTLSLGLLLGWAAPGRAAPLRVATSALQLAGVPEQVIATPWDGRPAALVVTRPRVLLEGETPLPHLYLLRLEHEALGAVADWTLPQTLRWAEPIVRPDGRRVLLGLVGHQWFLGEPEAGELKWYPLCDCPSVFSGGRDRPPSETHFVQDLNGDGIDEVLLPDRRGLTVYRQAPGERRLVALWQDRWRTQEKYERAGEHTKVTILLPWHLLTDTNGDGIVDLVQIEDNGLRITNHAWPAVDPVDPYFFVDEETKSDYADLKIPPALKKVLQSLPPLNFETPEAFGEALLRNQPPEAREEWAPHLPAVTRLAQVPVPVQISYFSALPALGEKRKGEDWQVLDAREMNGDGVLDVVHHKGIDTTDIFAQKNQLRWFAGKRQGASLGFEESPRLFFTEGPAFARVVDTRHGDAGTPALFVATMEVDLLAIIRALTIKKVSLEVYIYPWIEGKVANPASTQAALTFSVDFSNNRSRPMLFVADMDGDGWRDFIFNLKPQHLYVYRGNAQGAALDDGPIVSGPVPLPRRREEGLVVDLDGRPGEELLFWYRDKQLSTEEQRTVRMAWVTDTPAPPAAK